MIPALCVASLGACQELNAGIATKPQLVFLADGAVVVDDPSTDKLRLDILTQVPAAQDMTRQGLQA